MKEQFSNKLYHFQAEPPVEVWDNIASSLDSDPASLFPQKLFNYSAKPPEHLWNSIADNLEESSIPVIPITRRYSKVFRYGGVAAGMLVFAFVVSLFFNKTSVSTGTSSLDVLPENTNTSVQTEQQPIESQNKVGIDAGSNDGTNEDRDSYKNRNRWFAKKIAALTRKPATASLNTRISKVVPSQYPVVQTDMLERYILFSQNSGDAIRLSKKLFNLFSCPDNKINCRENIEIVQQQVASPTMIASTDFTGMLELLQNVK